MKTTLLLVMFAATVCLAQDTNQITTQVFERDKDKDGKIDFRMETTYRGKAKVMTVMDILNDRGVMTRTRSLLVAGKLAVTESDEDGDGHFERLIVYSGDRRDLEAFNRRKDGSVRPVSSEVLAIMKRQNALQEELGKPMRDLIERKTTPEQVVQAMMQILAKSADLACELREAEQRDKD